MGQSTEAVDNSVDKMGEITPEADAMRARVKLAVFSPAEKTHIFH
ncbi:hypothetical protein [Pseudomonas sp.]